MKTRFKAHRKTSKKQDFEKQIEMEPGNKGNYKQKGKRDFSVIYVLCGLLTWNVVAMLSPSRKYNPEIGKSNMALGK